MKRDLLIEIPSRSKLERLSHIPTTYDLASVILYDRAFTEFEESVVSANEEDLLPDRLPNHWLKEDYPDKNSARYICSVFKKHLPTLEELYENSFVMGDAIAIVGGGTCLLGSGYASDIDSHRIVCRLNHPYLFEHSADVGTKTTIHLFNERRLYDFTRQITRDDFSLLGTMNIGVGTVSKTACYLEYARYLDSGGDKTKLLVFKPSFLASIGVLHPNKKPTLGFVATAFALRVYGSTTLYGFDLGSSRKHYHGIDTIHQSHAVEFEAAELIHCESSLHNFKINS
jgi:hypothetical protein